MNVTKKEYDGMRKVCPHIFDLLNFLNEIHVALMFFYFEIYILKKYNLIQMKVWAWPLMMLISWYSYIEKPLVFHPHIILSLTYWLLHSIILFTYLLLFTFSSIVLFHLNFNFVVLSHLFYWSFYLLCEGASHIGL